MALIHSAFEELIIWGNLRWITGLIMAKNYQFSWNIFPKSCQEVIKAEDYYFSLLAQYFYYNRNL